MADQLTVIRSETDDR